MARLITYRVTSLWSPMALIFMVIGLMGFSTLAYATSDDVAASSQQQSTSGKYHSVLTQSDAHLAQEGVLPTVTDVWLEKIAADEELEKIIQLAMQRERQKSSDYFVFYHGQAGYFRILQDFLSAIYPHMTGKTIKDFEFLRFWQTVPHHADLPALLAGYGTTWQADHEPEIMKQLLSANLSLFGNTSYCQGECSFYFFLHSHNIHFNDHGQNADHLRTFLQEIFDYYTFNHSYIQEIVDLLAIIEADQGNLIQIFIPREQVDTYAYLSGPFGFPIIDPFKDVIENYNDKHANNYVPLSTTLGLYTQNPSPLKDYGHLQARIVMSQEGMLNPHSGIQIYRYTLENPEITHRYIKKLKRIIKRMLKEWHTRKKS